MLIMQFCIIWNTEKRVQSYVVNYNDKGTFSEKNWYVSLRNLSNWSDLHCIIQVRLPKWATNLLGQKILVKTQIASKNVTCCILFLILERVLCANTAKAWEFLTTFWSLIHFLWNVENPLKGVAAMWQTGVNLTYENN